MKLVSQTVLPSLLPGQVINDMANPIQLVTLAADNAWHDYDFSGYEIAMLSSSPLTFVKVNFSNAENGLTLVPGKSIKVMRGFAGCRLYLGMVTSGTVNLAISRIPDIELPKDKPSPLVLGFTNNYVDAQVIIDSGELPAGLYDIDTFWGANVNVNAGLKFEHRNAANSAALYYDGVYHAISPSMSKNIGWHAHRFAERERFRIVGSDTPTAHTSFITARICRVG